MKKNNVLNFAVLGVVSLTSVLSVAQAPTDGATTPLTPGKHEVNVESYTYRQDEALETPSDQSLTDLLSPDERAAIEREAERQAQGKSIPPSESGSAFGEGVPEKNKEEQGRNGTEEEDKNRDLDKRDRQSRSLSPRTGPTGSLGVGRSAGATMRATPAQRVLGQ